MTQATTGTSSAKKKKVPPASGKAAKPDAAKAAPKFKLTTKAQAEAAAGGIGAYAQVMIKTGKSNDEVLEAVKAQFPEATTSKTNIAWYRSKLKKAGEL